MRAATLQGKVHIDGLTLGHSNLLQAGAAGQDDAFGRHAEQKTSVINMIKIGMQRLMRRNRALN